MAYQKGEKVEAGIWKLADKKNVYLAEITYTDPQTRKRTRLRKTTNRLDLARDWRKSQKVDGLRDEILRRRDRRELRRFDVFADEYLDNWSLIKKKPSSYERDKQSVQHLKKYFGKRLISDISRLDVERYVANRSKAKIGPKDNKRSISPATINRELCCLKNMLRKAVDWDYIETNPAWGVKQSKEHPPEFEFLTFEEADRLVKLCAPHIRTFLVLALNTGMRKGELFNLEWRDVNFNKGQNGIITIRETKNHETRYIPMNAPLRAALENHPKRIVEGQRCPYVLGNDQGKPYTDLRGRFSRSLTDARLTRHIRIHDLRHTFASHLVMKGVDLRTVAKLLGHRDIKVTMRYAHLGPDHLQAAVDVLAQPSSSETAKTA